MQLLLIKLDPDATDFLVGRLSASGFELEQTASVEHALASGLGEQAAAVILDICDCNRQGARLVMRIRDAGLTQPLIVLAAEGDWRARVECLDAGADDFMFKPLRSEEIAARLRAIIRRASGYPTDLIESGGIELDLKRRSARLGGAALELTRTEFRLLQLFLLRAEEVLSHRDIHATLYPLGSNFSPNAVEVMIARLRRKVGRERIRTLRGVGYRYVRDYASSLQALAAFLVPLSLGSKVLTMADQIGLLMA